jgi:putative DNA primase/helicase
MTQEEWDKFKDRSHGHWTHILRTLGVPENILARKVMPCPMCDGTDRFQYTDRFGDGNYICRKCGAGGGLKLLQAINGLKASEAVQAVERCLGLPLPRDVPDRSASKSRWLIRRIWDSAQPLRDDDEVVQYLRSRDLVTAQPSVLRCHPNLDYFEKDAENNSRLVGQYPAMVALVQGSDGQVVSLHRTYLQNAAQIAGQAKKLLSSGVTGAAVRLFEPTDELAVTEGIETALAVYLATGRPVWSALNAGNMERIWIPPHVKRVCIYADNDAGFDGQWSAYALARRLKREDGQREVKREVHVEIPRRVGSDWADVWREMEARRCQ